MPWSQVDVRRSEKDCNHAKLTVQRTGASIPELSVVDKAKARGERNALRS